ncbi:MAG: histidine kinase, partial [Microbacteriaceae bacterium]|nr:histidine kinase [Microbacteriaceae bacterium]
MNYANLSPGRYTFKVQATTDGELFSDPLTVSFLIKKPLWQLWWFQLLLALALAAAIGLWVRAWSQRLKRTERARREKLEVENRLLQLEQKALQLQMNPHFIFNALTSIQ